MDPKYIYMVASMYDDKKFEGNSDYSRDIEFHLHSYTHPRTLSKEGPHIINKGDGIYVFDDTGKKFIEGMSGLWWSRFF